MEENHFVIVTEKVIAVLTSDYSGNSISKETGLAEATIRKYRNKKAKFENMTLNTANALYKFAIEKGL